jgi:hypothetical protein
MTTPSISELILKEIAQIQSMERGKLCQIRQGPNGAYFNHQTWEKGRNVVRYVARPKVQALQTAIAGYQNYLKLTQKYADLIIDQTRREQLRDTNSPSPNPKKPSRRPNRGTLE